MGKGFLIFAVGFLGGFFSSRIFTSSEASSSEPSLERTEKPAHGRYSRKRSVSTAVPSALSITSPEQLPLPKPQASSKTETPEHDLSADDESRSIASDCRDILLNGGPKSALSCAQNCLDKYPENTACRATLIWADNQLGRTEDASRYISECLRDDPEGSVCLSPPDFERVQSGDQQEAINFVGEVSRISPDSSWTNYLEALLEDRMGNHDVAQELYKKACEKGRATACGFLARQSDDDASRLN